MLKMSMKQIILYYIYITVYYSINCIYLSIYLSIYLPIYRSIYRSIDLSIYRSIDLSIYLSIYLSKYYIYIYIIYIYILYIWVCVCVCHPTSSRMFVHSNARFRLHQIRRSHRGRLVECHSTAQGSTRQGWIYSTHRGSDHRTPQASDAAGAKLIASNPVRRSG